MVNRTWEKLLCGLPQDIMGGKIRTSIDDLESLVFSMLNVAGVPVGQVFVADEQPEGFVLSELKKKWERPKLEWM